MSNSVLRKGRRVSLELKDIPSYGYSRLIGVTISDEVVMLKKL
jgi:hypothetical protein